MTAKKASVRLTARMKEEIGRAVVLAAVKRFDIQKIASEKFAEFVDKAYKLIYSTPQQREAAQLLMSANLISRIGSVRAESAGLKSGWYSFEDDAGLNTWRKMIENSKLFTMYRDGMPISCGTSLFVGDHYPFDVLPLVSKNDDGKALIAENTLALIEICKIVRDSTEPMRTILAVIRGATTEEDLVAKLPEIESTIREKVTATLPASLPAIANQVQVTSLLDLIKPV